ncbi:MAG: hypothetical protein KGK30_02670, partial [Elusimicrobia bacterium]|nr:hypothetical protein [Elusimicrobiota bacterium]
MTPAACLLAVLLCGASPLLAAAPDFNAVRAGLEAIEEPGLKPAALALLKIDPATDYGREVYAPFFNQLPASLEPSSPAEAVKAALRGAVQEARRRWDELERSAAADDPLEASEQLLLYRHPYLADRLDEVRAFREAQVLAHNPDAQGGFFDGGDPDGKDSVDAGRRGYIRRWKAAVAGVKSLTKTALDRDPEHPKVAMGCATNAWVWLDYCFKQAAQDASVDIPRLAKGWVDRAGTILNILERSAMSVKNPRLLSDTAYLDFLDAARQWARLAARFNPGLPRSQLQELAKGIVPSLPDDRLLFAGEAEFQELSAIVHGLAEGRLDHTGSWE